MCVGGWGSKKIVSPNYMLDYSKQWYIMYNSNYSQEFGLSDSLAHNGTNTLAWREYVTLGEYVLI